MKRDEIKKILKPLIKECIKEVIFEKGVLSGIISEVVSGVGETNKVIASTPQPTYSQPTQHKAEEKINEAKKRMLDAIGKDSYNNVNIFEGTEPISSRGGSGQPSPNSLFEGTKPTDPGVDITNIPGMKNWGKMI
tara:strand:+ start:8041 stop:8445 length:405 start_codon:yes stop_codon:yes gene_type:complete